LVLPGLGPGLAGGARRGEFRDAAVNDRPEPAL